MDTWGDLFGVLILLIICAVLFIGGVLVGAKLSYETGIKQGQIDCINGKIEYKLEKQPDNTTKWVKKQ